jgi:hypothetical protein
VLTDEQQRAIDETVAHLNSGWRFIINSNVPLEIGSRETIWSAGNDLIEIEQPLTILRECTFYEWQDNLPPNAAGRHRAAAEFDGYYFYECALD